MLEPLRDLTRGRDPQAFLLSHVGKKMIQILRREGLPGYEGANAQYEKPAPSAYRLLNVSSINL